MKKWLCLVMAGILLLTISACKKKSDISIGESTAKLTEPFVCILKNEQSFYSTERETDIFLSDYKKNIWQYTSVDMDSDNTPELAIMFEDGNILILRKKDTTVFGFDFGVHAMYQINDDGSFLWNEDTGNVYGCSTLNFVGNQYDLVELWRVEENKLGSTAYYIDGKSVSKEVFQSVAERGNKNSIDWKSSQ